MKKNLLVILMLCSMASYAQSSDFTYWKENCYCKAKYDSTKYSREQLQHTFDYLWRSPSITTKATAWTIEKIKELSLTDLDAECAKRIDILKSFEFVEDSFWMEQKENLIIYYESVYRLKKYTILAYSNPKILLEYDLVDDKCIYYRDALIAGGQSLLDAWSQLHEYQKSCNSNPEKLQQKFEVRFNSSQKLAYARLEIMKFGWWNSANRLLPHIDSSVYFPNEFERLLLGVECECD